jgi:hypothetical protein
MLHLSRSSATRPFGKYCQTCAADNPGFHRTTRSAALSGSDSGQVKLPVRGQGTPRGRTRKVLVEVSGGPELLADGRASPLPSVGKRPPASPSQEGAHGGKPGLVLFDLGRVAGPFEDDELGVRDVLCEPLGAADGDDPVKS